MRGSDGRFAAFHLMTEQKKEEGGRRDVRLSTLPHYPSSLLLFHSFPLLLLFLLPFSFSFTSFVSSSFHLLLPPPPAAPSSTLPSCFSTASLTPSVSSHHLIGGLPGIVLVFVPSNTCHKHTDKHKQWLHSVCVFVCRGELSAASRC